MLILRVGAGLVAGATEAKISPRRRPLNVRRKSVPGGRPGRLASRRATRVATTRRAAARPRGYSPGRYTRSVWPGNCHGWK